MYKITITKTEEKKVPIREYKKISDTGGEDDGVKYGYVHDEEIQNVETTLYTQKLDKDIDIKKVIDSFNQ